INDINTPLENSKLKIIDGKGGYITPGLIDMHVHMYEQGAYVLTLSHGVTHVRVMNGVPKQLEWRDNIASGIDIGSTSTVSSPIISGYKGAYLQHFVNSEQEAIDAAHTYKSQGYDLIKAYGNLSEDSLLGVLKESERLNIPVAKHGPHASGSMPISRLSGIQSFEHVEDIFQGPLDHKFTPEKLPKIIEEIKETNVPVTPTLNIYYQLTKISQEKEAYLANTSPEYTPDIITFETSTNQVKRWLDSSEKMASYNQKKFDFLQDITKRLNDNDVPLLVGSDSGVLLSPHGIATHNEMRLMKMSGLTSFEVLQAATLNPAKALGLNNKLGKLAKGYQADFIYTIDNPVTNLSVLESSEAVIKNGFWYNRATLNSMREKAIESRSLLDEFFVLFEGL
ncbi:MAG: amidohydrolase family protein, partial [Colwellia sp.]